MNLRLFYHLSSAPSSTISWETSILNPSASKQTSTNYQDYLLLGFPSKFYITVKTSVTEKLKWGPQCKHIARPKHTVVSPRGNTKFPKMPILLLKQNKISLGFPSGSVVKNLPPNAGDAGSIPGSGRSPEGGHSNPFQYPVFSSILAWRIPWTEEPGRLQSMGWQRVRHN